jgi:hypothetical protein
MKNRDYVLVGGVFAVAIVTTTIAAIMLLLL